MNNSKSTTAPANKASQSAVTPSSTRKKRKCAGVYMIRMILGLIIIILVIVITGVQAEGWEAIADALFGGITWFEVMRYAVIVLVSMSVGYWMKKPRKVYVKGEKQQIKSEANEKKAEE